MKDCLKNMIQLKKKLLSLATVVCYLRKWKKMVCTSQRVSFNYLKYGPSLKFCFHLYQWRFPLRGKPLNKRQRFLLARKYVSTSQNERFRLKKYFSTRREENHHYQESQRNRAKKMVATSQKINFLQQE